MYRLLGARLASLCKLPQASFGSNCESASFEVTERASLLLHKQLTNNNRCTACARFQSTVTNPSVAKKRVRKKRAKSQRKSDELLVVTGSSARQQKASVQKLTLDDLTLLAQTNLNLSELHKLRDLSKSNKFVEEHTYNNLTAIDKYNISGSSDIFTPDGAEASTKVITCDIPSAAPDPDPTASAALQGSGAEPEPDHLDHIPVVDPFLPEVGEEVENDVAERRQEVPGDRIVRYEVAKRTLASFVEVCSNLKLPQRGWNALVSHNTIATRRKKNKYFTLIRSVRVYNALLKGYAAKGDVCGLEEALGEMRKSGVSPDLQSYVAIFECLGRANLKDHYLKQIRIFSKEAASKGFTFDRLLNEGAFLNDSREVVLQAMRKYDPSYVPEYRPPKVQYDNELVNDLNDEAQLSAPQARNFANREGLFTPEGLKEAVKKQVEFEKEGHIVVRSVEALNEVTDDVKRYRQILAEHYRNWEEAALKAFEKDLWTLTSQKGPMNYEMYMRSIPVKEFVTIIVEEAKSLASGSETYSPTVNLLCTNLGYKVYARYKVLRKQKTGVLDKVIKIHNKYCKGYAQQHGKLDVLPSGPELLNPRQKWQWAEHASKHVGATLAMDHCAWNPAVLQEIGKFLYDIILHNLTVDVNAMKTNSKSKNYLPAFYQVYRPQLPGRYPGEGVKPDPVLSRLYRASKAETLTFPFYDLPMYCPPVPWTSADNGGYLLGSSDVVRLPPVATSQKQRLHEADPVQLYPSLDSLNQLAAVPWKVNTDILDVILKVFNSGGSSRLNVPEPPPVTDKTQKYIHKLQQKRKQNEMYSLWCDCLYKLSLANHFRNDVFWLPHNMDFRGRVYPVPPHLNHLGSDLSRSMLVFAESRPLGPQGLDWLKIHLINLTGLKKRDTVADRLVYANEVMDKILDSADEPLTGQMWWSESDEPWQTLACCMEIAKAARSPDPQQYMSHFPVHQDGSCNGLQHYAALGRDSAGAYSVNLCPSSTPQDVYSAVVAVVEEQRKRDAANGMEIAQQLEGFVKRKVIKQTVMTTVYGVTMHGARQQIARQLKAIENFPQNLVWDASMYLTRITFESLRSMFTSTREIQDWFTDCARQISKVGGQCVEWVTPLGLPVVQPYITYKQQTHNKHYKLFRMDQYEKPNVVKQKNAFPPNFIHSLDSSHMMLTSLYCERAGITFVSVHDCFWTHPSTVHLMNKICREQFVALHSQPILENLSLFLSEKYSYNNDEFTNDGSVTDLTKKKLNRLLRQLPKTGDFDINLVLESVYFFS